MKTLRITFLAVVIALFMISPAGAGLSPNLIQNSGFDTGTLANVVLGETANGTLLNSGQWYSAVTAYGPTYPYWDNVVTTSPPGPYSSTRYVRLSESGASGITRNDYLVQTVQVSSAWPGHVATAGPAQLELYYSALTVNAASYARLYGSDTQPTFGTYGTQLAEITGFNANSSGWSRKYVDFNASQGYQWYTVVIYGSVTYGSGTRYFGVDDVSVKVTPIPPAAWLLGTGLLALIGLRRKFKK